MVAEEQRGPEMKRLFVIFAVVYALVTGITAAVLLIPQPAVADCGGNSC